VGRRLPGQVGRWSGGQAVRWSLAGSRPMSLANEANVIKIEKHFVQDAFFRSLPLAAGAFLLKIQRAAFSLGTVVDKRGQLIYQQHACDSGAQPVHLERFRLQLRLSAKNRLFAESLRSMPAEESNVVESTLAGWIEECADDASGRTSCEAELKPLLHEDCFCQGKHLCKAVLHGLDSQSSQFFSIAAGVPEGAGGSGGPGAAPSAAPITQRSRKPPVRGCRLIQPPDLLPESLGGSQPREYTAASVTKRLLASAACTAGRGFGRQGSPPTGDGSGTHPGHVYRRVRQHSGRLAATMHSGGGHRGRPIEERPGTGSRHWLRCRRHCRPAALWCSAVGIGAGTIASAPRRACITRTVYDIHHNRRRVVNQALK
jgi:hypothetical protein